MSGPPLRVGMLGGVPPSLAIGGLERQMESTAAALRRGGHEVRILAREAKPWAFDVLHAFSSGPDVTHALKHWRRNAGVPLVVSPVMVVAPGVPEWRQRVAHRLPIPELGPRERTDLLRRADVLVALTRHEAGLLRRLGGRRTAPVVVVDNGVDPVVATGPPEGLPSSYVALVGSVGARKRQLPAIRALAAAGGPPPVVIGGFEDPPAARPAFEAAVRQADGVWLGEVEDPAVVRSVLRGADALVHLSKAEGQSLAVLESLAEGTPVAVAPLPGNRELHDRFPGYVALVESDESVAESLAILGRATDAPSPPIPGWDDVASLLEDVYRKAGVRPS